MQLFICIKCNTVLHLFQMKKQKSKNKRIVVRLSDEQKTEMDNIKSMGFASESEVMAVAISAFLNSLKTKGAA